MEKSHQRIMAIAFIIIIIIILYGILPLVLNTSTTSMHDNKSYYVYGNITNIITVNNKSFMEVNDYGNNIFVSYNGSVPSLGSYVLVHGKYEPTLLGPEIQANSIIKWYYSF